MILSNGWHQLSNEQYHEELEAVGSTRLSRYEQSAAHGKAYEEKVDDDIRFGSVVHAAILEPDVFENYVSLVEGDGRTKAVKEAREQQKEDLKPGQILVPALWRDKALVIRDTMHAHPTFRAIFKNKGFFEQSGVHRNEENGLAFKVKPDYRFESDLIVDIKTTDDARIHRFDRQIISLSYDMKAAFYLEQANLIEGKKAYDQFMWIAIESKAPHAVMFYEVGREWLERGRDRMKTALDNFIEAKKTGVYKGYPNEIITATPPAYAMYY